MTRQGVGIVEGDWTEDKDNEVKPNIKLRKARERK